MFLLDWFNGMFFCKKWAIWDHGIKFKLKKVPYQIWHPQKRKGWPAVWVKVLFWVGWVHNSQPKTFSPGHAATNSTQKLQGKSISSIVLTLSCNPRYDMDFDPCGDTVALTKAKPWMHHKVNEATTLWGFSMEIHMNSRKLAASLPLKIDD